ncbi:hypothetical protein [Nocardia sp. NPDC004722]
MAFPDLSRIFVRHSRGCPSSAAYRPQHGSRNPDPATVTTASECPRCRMLAGQRARADDPGAVTRVSAAPNFSGYSPLIGVLVMLTVVLVRPAWLVILAGVASCLIALPFPGFRKVVPWSWALVCAGLLVYAMLVVFVPAVAARVIA